MIAIYQLAVNVDNFMISLLR